MIFHPTEILVINILLTVFLFNVSIFGTGLDLPLLLTGGLFLLALRLLGRSFILSLFGLLGIFRILPLFGHGRRASGLHRVDLFASRIRDLTGFLHSGGWLFIILTGIFGVDQRIIRARLIYVLGSITTGNAAQ